MRRRDQRGLKGTKAAPIRVCRTRGRSPQSGHFKKTLHKLKTSFKLNPNECWDRRATAVLAGDKVVATVETTG
jgi:hypothetical protein